VPRLVFLVLAAALALAAPVRGSALTFSGASTDSTPASDLAWPLVADGGPGNPTDVGSFGTFDFMLDGPVGQTDPALIGSGESSVFVLAISGPGPCIAQPQTTASSNPLPTRGNSRPHRVEREDLR
jgi:hypothetical protein